MTREEIISGLKFTVEMFLLDPSTGETITEPRNDMDKTTIDACRGAIELLEQESKTGHCEDCKHFRKLPMHTSTIGKCIQYTGFCPKGDWYCADFEPQESED